MAPSYLQEAKSIPQQQQQIMAEQQIILEISADLATVQQQPLLLNPNHWQARAKALDCIEFYILDRLAGMAPDPELEIINQEANLLKRCLENADQMLYDLLRQEIIRGKIPLLLKELQHSSAHALDLHTPGYDAADDLINGLMYAAPIPDPLSILEPEMVHYQKTPVGIVFEMLRIGISEEDVFFDIGSGLGQVSILINLLSGANTIGIEFEPAYYHYSMQMALALNLKDVQFVNANARYADYVTGTIFYFYTPFDGTMLQQVLRRLEEEAQSRNITIFSYGRCSLELQLQSWLTVVNKPVDNIYSLYQFRSRHHQ